jgi:hypothetical protein
MLPLTGLLFNWSNRDVGILFIFLGSLFMLWFLFGIWIVGLGGIAIFILGLLFLMNEFED